ncbi:MAG TPA: alfa-L-rhamnosidase, partial [candidate division Zixibacteria bacterium]|nr:alfa-L-rhamnosidase [candidate division Zixibacteria bacterium]
EYPRFFWNVTGANKQTAYSITAQTDGKIIWQSGKVFSGSMRAAYAGPSLESRQRVEWSVTLWDENDAIGGETSAFFEMGLLDPSDWMAKWITADLEIDKKVRYPVDSFKKEFNTKKTIKRARIYLTACGLYEALLNGTKVGNAELTPGLTDYRKRVQYQTFDVTDHLRAGANSLEISLADGWYRGYIGALSTPNVFGERTKLLCQLEIDYADGTQEVICSDDSYSWSNDGAIRYADLKNGEIVDAGRKPSYTGQARLDNHPITPTASNNVLIQQHERFTPKLITSPSGKRILDFGQNLAGYIEFHLQGQKGQKAILKMGEALDHDEFTQVNFQGKMKNIDQKIEFTCSGEEDFYRTKFAIFGFRYALVEGLEEIHPNDFSAIAVYSSMEETGDFACSNELINLLVKNTRWSMKGNFADAPTDCPTRERAPWTGDAQIFCNTASYLMNTAPFFGKWLGDLADRQAEDGKVQCIVPSVGDKVGGMQWMDGCVGWGDASIFIPYRCYQMYDDPEFLRHFYPMMKGFAEFSIRRAAKTFFANWFKKNPYRKYTYDTGQHFGEWLEPEGVEPGNMIVNIILPRPEEATAYFHYQMRLMSETANILGYESDSKRYAEYADGAKKAYSYLFVKENTIKTDRQAKLVRPLALGLLDGEVKKNVEDRLEKVLSKNDWKIGTGFLSTPFILPVLTETGKLDAAFKVLENEEVPGWLFAPKQGATTIWESWEGYDNDGIPKASHNHYAFGAVCEWLFNTVAGINVAGENEFLIAPQFGGTLTHASAKYQSIFGEVSSSWKLKDGIFNLEVDVPSNCTAKIILPNRETHKVEHGHHILTIAAD